MTREPVLPPAWGDVLDQVQQSLTGALEQADHRLQALSDAAAAAPPAAPDAAARPRFDARLDAAERQVTDADAALAAAEEALRAWLDAGASAQRTLAARAAGAIG
jgi:hypothetical protein